MSDWYEEMEKAEQEHDAMEYELAQEYRRGYEQGRSDAIDEFLYFLGTKLAQISIEPDVRATLYAELNIKAKELKEKKV